MNIVTHSSSSGNIRNNARDTKIVVWLFGMGSITSQEPELRPGARFSKLPVISGPVKLFCFPF